MIYVSSGCGGVSVDSAGASFVDSAGIGAAPSVTTPSVITPSATGIPPPTQSGQLPEMIPPFTNPPLTIPPLTIPPE